MHMRARLKAARVASCRLSWLFCVRATLHDAPQELIPCLQCRLIHQLLHATSKVRLTEWLGTWAPTTNSMAFTAPIQERCGQWNVVERYRIAATCLRKLEENSSKWNENSSCGKCRQYSVRCIVSRGTAALIRTKPSSAGTSGDSCRAQKTEWGRQLQLTFKHPSRENVSISWQPMLPHLH